MGSDLTKPDYMVPLTLRGGLQKQCYAILQDTILLFVDTPEASVRFNISSDRGVQDFLLVLKLERYVVVEMLAPSTVEGLPSEAIGHLEHALSSLEEARKRIFTDLSAGHALTALRNALDHLCQALIPLKLAYKDESTSSKSHKTCKLSEEGLEELCKGRGGL